MTRRRPHANSVWPTRRDLTGAYVTTNDDLIALFVPGSPGSEHGMTFRLDRQEARLLAKRLNQCLDATVLR